MYADWDWIPQELNAPWLVLPMMTVDLLVFDDDDAFARAEVRSERFIIFVVAGVL